jgi:alkanesulfonate monooxygenase
MTTAIEFIGSVIPPPGSAPTAALADPDYPVQVAGLVDEAGFDKLVIGYDPHAADGLIVANGILTTTSRLGVVVPVVPGLVAPTVAARQLATLAAFHPGRVAVQIIIDADPTAVTIDSTTARPGTSTRRAAEFLQVVELAWAARQPFDYAGEFYQVTGAASAIHPGSGRLPVYLWMRGADAFRVGAANADFCIFSFASVPVIAGRVAEARAAAARHGRSPRFGVSVRLLAAQTEPAARDRLEAARPAVGQRQGQRAQPRWFPPAPMEAGPASEPSTIAGSYDQIAEVLLGYIGAGVSSLVIEHDPHAEAADCAAVIERVRATVQARRGLPSGAARRQGLASACRPSAAACPQPGSRA